MHVVSPGGATLTKAEGASSVHRRWVSLVEVSGCTETPLKLGFRLSFDRNSILGYNKVSGGSISEGKRWVRFEFVPDRKSTRLNSSHESVSRMPSSA